MRGLAALAVAIGHAPLIGDRHTALGIWGRPAVMVFYALSGFLLYYPWAKACRVDGIGRYYWRRVWRIYPAYIVALAAGGVIAVTLDRPILPGDIASHLTFTHSWFAAYSRSLIGPAWSLPAEMQFYAILPLLGVLFIRRPFALALAAVGLGILQTFPPDAFTAPGSRFLANWPYLAFPFFLGMIAGQLAASQPPRWLGWCAPLGAVGVLAYELTRYGVDYRIGILNGPIATALPSLAAGLVVIGVTAAPASVWGRALSRPPVRALGICGYGLFLFHWPLFQALKAAVSPVTGLVIGLPAALALAVMSYLYVEAPAMRRSRRRAHPAASRDRPAG